MCWQEDPELRPSAEEVFDSLKPIADIVKRESELILAQQKRDQEKQLNDKLIVLGKWIKTAIENDIQPKLEILSNKIKKEVNDIPDVLPIGTVLQSVKAVFIHVALRLGFIIIINIRTFPKLKRWHKEREQSFQNYHSFHLSDCRS
jgi:hypothetical protein